MKMILSFFGLVFLHAASGCLRPAYLDAPEGEGALSSRDRPPVEMHLWSPPTDQELEERRQNQRELDAISADLERLFMTYADILADEIILENLIRAFDPKLQQMEAGIVQGLSDLNQVQETNTRAVDELKESVQQTQSRWSVARAEREARLFHEDDYRAAIRLFRDKAYRESIGKFRKVWNTDHPAHLKDNILFGLASNYFRLNQLEPAVRYLEQIREKYPSGEKWLIAHALLAVIYDLKGRNSRAIYILETALKQNPEPELARLLTRLLGVAQGKASHARS